MAKMICETPQSLESPSYYWHYCDSLSCEVSHAGITRCYPRSAWQVSNVFGTRLTDEDKVMLLPQCGVPHGQPFLDSLNAPGR